MLTRCLKLSLLLVLFALTVTADVRADAVDDAVIAEMKALAESLKPYFDKHRFRTVAIKEIAAPSSVAGGAGLELEIKLAKELERLGLIIDDIDPDVTIAGRYQRHDDQNKRRAVKIIVELFDPQNNVVQVEQPSDLERLIYGQEAVPRLLGIAYESPPNADYEFRSEAIRKAEETPKLAATGSVIANSPGSPYALEILVKQADGQYVPVEQEAKSKLNLPFVPIEKTQVYAVRLINKSPYDAAVNLTIDGINAFEFSSVSPKPTFWLVPADSSVLVEGWHKTNEISTEFKVVDFPETAVAKLKLKPHEKIGLIQAAFSAAWSDVRPPDELSRGTGFGQDIRVATKIVRRSVGGVRETIVVRYERGKE